MIVISDGATGVKGLTQWPQRWLRDDEICKVIVSQIIAGVSAMNSELTENTQYCWHAHSASSVSFYVTYSAVRKLLPV
jgi:hypothetical protein